jgi:hypothetical protein
MLLKLVQRPNFFTKLKRRVIFNLEMMLVKEVVIEIFDYQLVLLKLDSWEAKMLAIWVLQTFFEKKLQGVQSV